MSILLSHQCWTHGLPYPEKKMSDILKKYQLTVYTSQFGCEKFESTQEPVFEDGWLRIMLTDGVVCFSMDKVAKYSISIQVEK